MKKFLFAFIGFLLGICFTSCYDKGLFTSWELIGKPEIRITQILGANENTVYVSAETGSIYSYTYWIPGSKPEKVWKQVIDKNFKIEPNNPVSYFTSPPLLQKIKQEYETAIYPLVEAGGVVKLRLSEDGNVWMWKQVTIGMGLPVVYVEFSVMGLIAGIILSILIDSLISLYRRLPLKRLP